MDGSGNGKGEKRSGGQHLSPPHRPSAAKRLTENREKKIQNVKNNNHFISAMLSPELNGDITFVPR